MALNMHPHQEQHEQRHEDVYEYHQREKAAAERRAVEKVVRDRFGEKGQGIQPLGGCDGDVLRQLVPDEPVAADAANIDEEDRRHAGYPGEEALAAQSVERKFPQQMQNNDDNQRVRGIAVQAAHDAGQVPLLVRDVLDGCIGIGHAGVKEDIQVDAGAEHDPEEIPAQRTQPGKGIEPLTER